MNKLIKNAFTLIELLVVIAIIGILSGLIVVSMGGMTTKATIAKAQVFSNSLRNSLMMNLVSEWKFNENSGSTTNNNWNGGITGNLIGPLNLPVWRDDCVEGFCLEFDGIEDYVDCGNNNVLDSLSNAGQDSTWSLWFKTSNSGVVIGKYVPFQFRVSSGKLGAYIYNGSNQIIGSPWEGTIPVSDNKWHHAVYVVDRDYNFFAYVDGVKDGNPISISAHYSENWAKGAGLFIGVRNPGSAFFTGEIDDVRIYNAVLTVSQIQEQYYLGLNKMLNNGNISKGEYVSRINNVIAKK